MPRMRAKGDLPEKPCRHCQRPMVWRKRWRSTWDNVLYCSDRCRNEARGLRSEETPTAKTD